MNQVFTAAWTFVKKNPYSVLLTLFVLWMCIGIFPLQCYEFDGQEITLGCDVMYREGWSLPPVYSYEYRMQPLMTVLLVALKHVLPFFTCEQVYCFLSAVLSLVFLLGCISFARHITRASKTWILIAAMLLPEMYAIAMYANTAIPAAACFIWAMILLSKERYWLTGLLLCLAVLFRIDVVTAYPAILPLLIFDGKSWKRAIGISAAYGVTVVVVCLFFFWLMNAEALNTFGAYQKWSGIITASERFAAILGFYSLAYVVLLPLGVGVMAVRKYWKELFLVLLPILLTHYIFASFGNASKHFLYIAPFVIIAGVRALMWLKEVLRHHPVMKWAVIVAIVLFMVVSVRKGNLNMPWIYENPLTKAGVVVPFYETERGDTFYSVGLGAGYELATGDENMLLTGHLFYSWYIHLYKQMTGEWRKQQKAFIDNVPTSNILTLEYGSSAPISFEYLTENYHFKQLENMPETYRFTLSNPQRDLHFWRIVLDSPITDNQRIINYIDSLSSDFLDGDAYILSAPNYWGTYYFMDELVPKGILEKKAERLYKIVRKKVAEK
ncbi:MAG: DUF2029 domain-containing protein [Prevotella sp.]|nr:DUF2029 domain-containing protein [Prevotella sp.]